MLTILLTKLIATALVVIGVSVTVGKLGPRLGGIIAGTPIIIGPGYFFMLQERSTEFIQAAALATLHALIATLLFSITFVLTAERLGAMLSLGLATVIWIPGAYLFSFMPGGFVAAAVVYGAVLLSAEMVKHVLALKPPKVVAASGWFDLVLRGLLAGVLVASATTLAARSGPMLSGILVGFPVGLLTIGWTLHDRYGASVARATVAAAQQGMLSLVAFAVITALLVGYTSPRLIFLYALLASIATSTVLFMISQWRFRRANSNLQISSVNNNEKSHP